MGVKFDCLLNEVFSLGFFKFSSTHKINCGESFSQKKKKKKKKIFFFAEKTRGAFVLQKLFIFSGKKCNFFAYNTFENLTPH